MGVWEDVMFNLKCRKCEIYQQQIEYLKKLIDNLLINKGIAPITPQEEVKIEETEDEKADRALRERGAVRYGD